MEFVGEGRRGGQRRSRCPRQPTGAAPPIVRNPPCGGSADGRGFASACTARPPQSPDSSLSSGACTHWAFVAKPEQYPNALRILQGWDMTTLLVKPQPMRGPWTTSASTWPRPAVEWGVPGRERPAAHQRCSRLRAAAGGLARAPHRADRDRGHRWLSTRWPPCCCRGLAVAVFNPRAAREFARSMGHLAKTMPRRAGAGDYAHTRPTRPTRPACVESAARAPGSLQVLVLRPELLDIAPPSSTGAAARCGCCAGASMR